MILSFGLSSTRVARPKIPRPLKKTLARRGPVESLLTCLTWFGVIVMFARIGWMRFRFDRCRSGTAQSMPWPH
jgi:hypothetical protein